MPELLFEGSRYSLLPGESVLDALIRGGANVPFSCRKGTCQNCLLQVEAGDPGPDARKGLRSALVEHNMFLPCCSHPESDLVIERPDLSKLFVTLHLAEKRWLSESICSLSFEPETQIDWRAGQFVNLRRPDGVTRSYSIASIPELDYFLTIHVKRIPGGVMSGWLCEELEVGGTVDGQGPQGDCYYEPEFRDQNLLLLATGSGLSPLHGVLRDALRHGHPGDIILWHGSRNADGLYLRDELRGLSREHANVRYYTSLTQEPELPEEVMRGRIIDLAFDRLQDLDGWKVFLCGLPEMVHEARCRAVLAGARRSDIRADPFEYAHQYQPDDGAEIARIKPDPELWEALDHGKGLTEILTNFYDAAFADPRLSPFFHKVTKRRAIEQQYAFLADLICGRRAYFGLRPFNAHHWMVISDELFDYREALIEGHMRNYGLSEQLIRRWGAIHERFRRAIVKSSMRGMIIDGKEQPLEPPCTISVDVATICDHCSKEMPVGVTGQFVAQTGQLFCSSCSETPAAAAAATGA